MHGIEAQASIIRLIGPNFDIDQAMYSPQN